MRHDDDDDGDGDDDGDDDSEDDDDNYDNYDDDAGDDDDGDNDDVSSLSDLIGYNTMQCLKVGFDVSALRAAGFSDYDLLSSGLFSDRQLKLVGCDVQRVALLTFFNATGKLR